VYTPSDAAQTHLSIHYEDADDMPSRPASDTYSTADARMSATYADNEYAEVDYNAMNDSDVTSDTAADGDEAVYETPVAVSATANEYLVPSVDKQGT